MGSVTNQSMFEALFDRRLKPEGPFAADLTAAGYDPGNARARYPTEVWLRCLEIARRHRWPDEPPEEAYRQLGREFALGFLDTLVGRLVGAALPFMSPTSFLNRLASYFRMGREDSALRFVLSETTPTSARAVVHNPDLVPGTFVAGLIEIALERLGRRGAVEVRQRTPSDYELLVRWDPVTAPR